jgi:hypothetical protein
MGNDVDECDVMWYSCYVDEFMLCDACDIHPFFSFKYIKGNDLNFRLIIFIQ